MTIKNFIPGFNWFHCSLYVSQWLQRTTKEKPGKKKEINTNRRGEDTRVRAKTRTGRNPKLTTSSPCSGNEGPYETSRKI